MNKRQLIVATAFIFKDGKVLLIKRSDKETFLPGYWELPGGKVDFGETVEEAVAREVSEETNLKVTPKKLFSSFSYVSNNGLWHTIDFLILCSTENGYDDVRLSGAHADHKWVTPNEVDDLRVSEEIKGEIKKGFKEMDML